jgi:hypothetical protein
MDPVSILLGVLGVAVGAVVPLVLFRLGQRDRAPRWAIYTANIVSPEFPPPPELIMTFQGRPIERLSTSFIAIWNAGRGAISESDVRERDPIRIQAPRQAVRILNARVIQSRFSTIPQFRIHIEQDDCAVLRFEEFLNHRQGCVVQVFHTGSSSADLEIRGEIQAASRWRRVDQQSTGYITKLLAVITLASILVITIVNVGLAWIDPLHLPLAVRYVAAYGGLSLGLLLATVVVIWWYLSAIPWGLNIYTERIQGRGTKWGQRYESLMDFMLRERVRQS